MEKILKKILLFIPLLIISFHINSVYADELIDIYSFSTGSRKIDNISYTSFGDYNSLSFSLFDTYNYTLQLDSSVNVYNNYILFYNKNYDYYLLLLFYNPGYNPGVFTATDSKTNKFLICSNDTFSTCSNGFYVRFIYKDLNSLNDINRIFTMGTFSSIDLDNFYISFYQSIPDCNGTCMTSFTQSLYSNIEDFYFIESNTDYYLNGEKQVKTTYSELNNSEEPEEPEEPEIPIYNFTNNKYYVPNYHEGQCVEILDKDTIRVFENETTDFYTDYYINSNYISKQGQVDLNYIKNCSNLEFTDIRYYSNDFPKILFITLVLITFSVGFPYVLYKRFRKR